MASPISGSSLPPSAQTRSLHRLLGKFQSIEPVRRFQVWRAYRHARQAYKRGVSPSTVGTLAQYLSALVEAKVPYPVVSLGLKLAQAHTLGQLRRKGALSRTERAMAREWFHLVRLALRTKLGLRDIEPEPRLEFGQATSGTLVTAFSDGGVRAGRAAAAFCIQDDTGRLVVSSAIELEACNALEAELAAAILCLSKLLELGLRECQLCTDSLGVLCAFQGRLPLKYCVEESNLVELTGEFKRLVVCLIPRAFNAQSDRLASELLQGRVNSY